VSWSPDPAAFLTDLEAIPGHLRALADRLADDPWPVAIAPRRVVLVGMGSSRYAALAAAARLRARGFDAVAERASDVSSHPGGPGTLAVAISAGGTTAETVATARRHGAAGSTTVALTDAPGSVLAGAADAVVELDAGTEGGGVACRTYIHTLARLMQLEAQLSAADLDPAALARRAAGAAEELLERRASWLPAVADVLGGTGRCFLLAPGERFANAEQGALTFREGPRLHADACETADWLHVDVYLTKPLDYRALVFAGSAADGEVMGWMRQRGARVAAVGSLDGAAAEVPAPGGADTSLLIEILVPQLAAAAVWAQA
jgi:fructoselysine-6-P-deglycase FrlB-like protein